MNKDNKIKSIQEGCRTAFVDSTYQSSLAYRPEFISNDASKGRKVLVNIERELGSCSEFMISVAFITMSGITPLLQTLKELEEKNIPGRILTTDYLCFSEPAALEKLACLKNITLKMFVTDDETAGFHTKGYIFKRDETYHFIIGSSNMTLSAFTRNREWNTKFVSTENGEMATEVLGEFKSLWNDSHALDYNDFIENYRARYLKQKLIHEQQRQALSEQIVDLESYRLQPNKMQVAFVQKFMELVNANEGRALLISATGTGKTYASAFAMRELNPERMLFIVHREQIAKQALKSYRRVFGGRKTYGLISGNRRETDADFLFATMQMMAKEDMRKTFKPDDFTCIILDECHHTGAKSYQKIMQYFKPRIWLGMTASPDTSNYDIYQLFNHNIAYEIRLQQAMEENILCPFHYFGITDIEVDGQAIDETSDFAYLTSEERVSHILDKAEYFGHSGERVKGLIFCSRKRDASELSRKFNQRPRPDGSLYRTCVLTGEDSQDYREQVINRLTEDEGDDKLDYIFTVDIFNEGVDIPEINQVIMLRPTQSPVVFVQQLGRGLRKSDGKEYVVVLDFIGNYNNNFMIPIALSGDRTYNKDNVRRYVAEGERVIPGSSTIHFDEISRKRIFASIDQANFSDSKLIKENYTALKHKLGHIPALKDFDDYGEMDVCRIFDNKSFGSYYKFLVKCEKDYKIRLTEAEERVIEFVSKKFANGKRIQELKLLKRIMMYTRGFVNTGLMSGLAQDLGQSGKTISQNQYDNIVNVMTNEFQTGSGKNTYAQCIFIEKESLDYKPSASFAEMLKNNDFYNILKELVDFGISRHERDFSKTYAETDFVLYQKYTYEDVCRLLNWEQNVVSLNIGGYKFDSKTRTFPVFINYDKADDISDTTKYEDHFEPGSRDHLIAISKSGRSLHSEDVQNFLHAKERGIQVELFVRKNKDDNGSKEFYYLGHMAATGEAREFTMPNTQKTAVEIKWQLDEPVREDIYEYIVNV